MAGPSCYEAIVELDRVMYGNLESYQDYYVLGGVVSGALADPATVIDHDGNRVVAQESSAQPVLRENGTKRDVDILVNAILEDDKADAIKSDVEKIVNGELVVSVFGVDEHSPPVSASKRFKSTLSDWLSHRTLDEDGTHRIELYPLEQTVHKDTYEPWSFIMPNGKGVSALSPAGHVLSYGLRSISGVRYKDTEKLGAMVDQVFADDEFHEEIVDGIFRSWLEFAVGIYDLRDGRLPADSPLLVEGVSAAELMAFSVKGKFLRALEGQERLIQLAQTGPISKLLNVVVKAR